MSLYAEYIREREDFETLESNQGFATYKIINDECYLRDIFVAKEHRKSNIAAELADQISEIARKAGCTKLLGSVCPSAKGSTTSVKVLLAYGMSVKSSSNDFIVFEKDL